MKILHRHTNQDTTGKHVGNMPLCVKYGILILYSNTEPFIGHSTFIPQLIITLKKSLHSTLHIISPCLHTFMQQWAEAHEKIPKTHSFLVSFKSLTQLLHQATCPLLNLGDKICYYTQLFFLKIR